MNLIDHVLNIRILIHRALEAQMERGGMDASEREEKLKPCVFTLFNRLAAIKLMEQKELFPEVIKQRAENGGLSAAHQAWLEEHPEGRSMERDGLIPFLEDKFEEMAQMNFRIYQRDYPYAMMPTADELNEIIKAFNDIENDPDCSDTWQKDDILGWLYENFNTAEKVEFKNSDEKVEYDKVSLQSQVYTPSWVVKFLVDNTLGKLYLEMFPESQIDKADENGRRKYAIANRPTICVRPKKDLRELRLIDPACGSGNFLLYAFSMLYDLYIDQIENFGADYNRREIPALIVENNIYGVDIDERAVQLSQIGLLIKARELGGRRARMPEHTNVVCTNFKLPTYEEVKAEFGYDATWERRYDTLARKIWTDLSEARKFGTLVRVEEQLNDISPSNDDANMLFSQEEQSGLFDENNKLKTQIHNLVNKYSEHNRNLYTLLKMSEAMTFLDVISSSFDVVVANPPYTDSSDFGTDLKAFVEDNYRKPLKFNINLYACFINRCCELAGTNGKVGMVNPPTFMYIKTFEDTRKFILEKTHINLFVEWGYLGIFSSFARVDSALFVLEMDKNNDDTTFIKLNDLYEMKRKGVLFKAYADYLNGIPNDRVYTLPQNKLKGIKSYPFIYWISDEFREKFGKTTTDDVSDIRAGIQTSNNNRFLRYPWEIKDIRTESSHSRWVLYAKGGPYCKWHGNIWLTIDWKDEGEYLQNYLRSRGQDLHAQEYYFKDGITYSSKGSGSISFRDYSSNCLFDIAGSCIFSNGKYNNLNYYLGFLNSNLVAYIIDCLNPTVNKQPNDLKRIPFVRPNEKQEKDVDSLVSICRDIKKEINKYSLIEQEFELSPITTNCDVSTSLRSFFNQENALQTQILLNEAIINKIVYEVYDLSDHDRLMVIERLKEKGVIVVGDLPVSHAAKDAFCKWLTTESKFTPSSDVIEHLNSLEEDENLSRINDFEVLYQTNKEWEEFCIQHKMNPVEVWWQFKNSGVLPQQRIQIIAFELITDIIRSLLDKDDDGVIPLVGNAGEVQLAPRIEAEMVGRGYNAAQIAQVFTLLGSGNLQRYLQEHFFAQLSDHLNLFMYLPKTPFIWHLTSGPHHALELFVSIYKWNRDTLLRIKSVYAANREAALNDRLQVLQQGDATQKADAAEVRQQLKELNDFCEKIDKLLASGYNPKLDDGVGKNIAPLQKVGLISDEVLNSSQLNKYLNADW